MASHLTGVLQVLMDEVGRGTIPEDGIAVGYACLHYLHYKIRCRTLFATHFHALVDMTADFKEVSRWCTTVAEQADGSWVYVHKLRRGVNRDSHALKVAKLAGEFPFTCLAPDYVLIGYQDYQGKQSPLLRK